MERSCIVYESRIEDKDDNTARVTTLWFDPATGFPVRLVADEVLEDGTVRRDYEYDVTTGAWGSRSS